MQRTKQLRFFRLAGLCGLLFSSPSGNAQTPPRTDSLCRRAAALLSEPRTDTYGLHTLSELITGIKTVQPDTAFRWTAELRRRAKAAGDKKMQVTANYHEASLYIITSKRRLARRSYAEGTKLAAQWGLDSLEAQGIAGEGTAFAQDGDYKQGLEYQFRALRLREAQADAPAIATSYASIGYTYHLANRSEEAERYTDRALAIYRELPPQTTYLHALHTKANILGMNGRLAEARALDSVGLAVCDRMGTVFERSMFYDNLANCYAAESRWGEAEGYYRMCLTIDSGVGNLKQMGDTYLHLGVLAQAGGSPEEALACYKHGIALATAGGDLRGTHDLWMELAPLYRRLQMPDSAYAAMEQAYALRDSLLSESTHAKLDELSTLYETELKERKIAEQGFEISRQRYLLGGGGGLALLAGGAAWGYMRRQRLRQRLAAESALARAREEAARAVVLAGESERSRLGRELHDGVGQVMAAARLNLSALEQKLPTNSPEAGHLGKATALIDNAATEMRALAHAMAPEPLVRQGLHKTVQELVRQLQTDGLRISLHADPLPSMQPDTAVTLYRILQECLQNAMRHGAATEISVTLLSEARGLSLMVEDNGRGFDPLAVSEGIGLANMRTRAAYLGGTLEVDAGLGRGTIVAVHVPAGTEEA